MISLKVKQIASKAAGKWTDAPMAKKAVISILTIYVLIALAAPLIMPYTETDISHPSMHPPSKTYLLGTDEIGHDLFSLLIFGFRNTTYMALISGFFSTLIGTILGYISCVARKSIETILVEIANLLIIIPEIIMIMFFSALASPAMVYTIAAIIIFSWPKVFKIMRYKIKNYLNGDKIKYTMLLKGNTIDICRKLWPDIFPVITSFFILQCNKAVMYETTLSFFGIGDPLKKTWGKLIKAAINYEYFYYDTTFLWYLLPPVACVIMFVLCLAFLVNDEDSA